MLLGEIIRALLYLLVSLGAADRAPTPPEPVGGVEPLTLAFYYPWYGSPDGPTGRWLHWRDVDDAARTISSSPNWPTLGPYDSHDPVVIDRHMRWIKQAGIDAVVVSWWGEGTHEDRAVPLILDAAERHGRSVSLYVERTPGDATGPGAAEGVAREMLGIVDRYAQHPAYLRVGGRPVLFAYVRLNQQLTNRGWRRVLNRLSMEGDRPVLIADRPPDPIRPYFDGWHTYDPMGQIFHERDRHVDLAAWAAHTFESWIDRGNETAAGRGGITCVTICPGYDERYFRPARVHVPREAGETYRTLWREAIEADPDWVLITSFNEWHEASEIEPSDRHGTLYLDITREMTAERRARRD